MEIKFLPMLNMGGSVMENNQSELEFERKRLVETISLANKQLNHTRPKNEVIRPRLFLPKKRCVRMQTLRKLRIQMTW